MRASFVRSLLPFFFALVPLQAAAAIDLVSFGAEQNRNDVVITWRTASEGGNAGYNVYREQGGVRTRVNRQLVGGPFATMRNDEGGYSYRLRDTVASSAASQYWLEAVDLHGGRAFYGPIAPMSTSLPLSSGPLSSPGGLGAGGYTFLSAAGEGTTSSRAMPLPTAAQKALQLELAAGGALKLFVSKPGWYRVTRGEMVAAGFDPGSEATKVGLYCGGIEQPIAVDTGKDGRFDLADFIEFYGAGLDAGETGARTYWLRAGDGRVRFAARPFNSLKAPRYAASVPFTTERRDRWFFVPYLTSNPAWDGWAGVAIAADGTEDRDFMPTVVELDVVSRDAAATGPATLELDLQGITFGMHIVQVQVAGRVVGTAILANQETKSVSFDFPSSWLTDGKVRLQLTSLNGWEDYSGLQAARLTYPHLLRADDGLFQAELPPDSTVTVSGFPSAVIRAIDVTDPLAPGWLDVKVAADGAAYSASFVTPAGSVPRAVLVLSDRRFRSAPEMAANRPSSWTKSAATLSADMVVVTHPAFADAARALEAVRDAAGVETVVVDVDDIYDEVNFGIRSAEAIRAFFRSTSTWGRAPRFAMLIGDASFDPRDYFELGSADFIPTRMVTTEYEKSASDDWFTDFDGDDIADLPIGRLPARTPADAALMVSKVTARASSGDWLKKALFVADANIGWNFERSLDLAAASVPSTMTVQKIRRGRGEIGALMPALHAGSALVEYIGHGTVDAWTGSFNASGALALGNGDRLPVVITMTCLNGYFQDIYQDSLAEAFLKAPNGGASAVWASSTLTYPNGQEVMNNELMRQLFPLSGPAPSIGEAMARAKRAMPDRDIRKSWILFGDPSMTLR